MAHEPEIPEASYDLLESCQRARRIGEWLLGQLEGLIESNTPPDDEDAWLWGNRDTMVTHYTRLTSHLTKILQLEDKLAERCAEQAHKIRKEQSEKSLTTRQVNDEDRAIIRRFQEKLAMKQSAKKGE